MNLKVFQIAKELGINSKLLVKRLQADGIPNIETHMSPVSLGLAETIRHWHREGKLAELSEISSILQRPPVVQASPGGSRTPSAAANLVDRSIEKGLPMYPVVFTKSFNGYLRELAKAGTHGKKSVQKCRAAIAEAGMEGQILSLARTNHGESRLPNIEKFELGDGHRLVVQLVDGKTRHRAFLFAGDHEDAERWLNNHRDYRWVKKTTDGTLVFTQVTVAAPQPIPDMDIESPEALLALPLLRDLTAEQWSALSLTTEGKRYAAEITAQMWENDASGVVSHIEDITGFDKACLLCDLLEHASKREWDSLSQRIDLAVGQAKIANPTEAAASMLAANNSETFVTWEDSANLPLDGDWADWMLFLHPEQKRLAKQDFNGAARLRGVSGSGKTCVLLHRAKYLAKKYQLPVRIITLTVSTQKLLNNLVARLCGVESQRIHVSTMAAFAREILQQKKPSLLSVSTEATSEQIRNLESQIVEFVRRHAAFDSSPLKSLSVKDLRVFVVDEVNYIRSRLRPTEYESYTTKQFKRHGRKIALVESSRQMFLDAVKMWDSELMTLGLRDHLGIISTALAVVDGDPTYRYRNVLVDEVQDLSQIEVALLSRLQTQNGEQIGSVENGLFLVGDGAQTIYKRGFSLANLGISIANRSYVLQKNYRNSKEILAASFRLISTYEFADVDEDNVQKPTQPHYPSRHGEKPSIVKCDSEIGEANFVATLIGNFIDGDHIPGQICVIGFSRNSRDLIAQTLGANGTSVAELRDDADFDSQHVKISTVESAKGHEFSTVFVVGLNAGSIPGNSTAPEEKGREASRLYVAMTRARDSLYMSYAADEYLRPSEFLLPIAEDCTELEYANSELRKPEG